MTEMRTKAGMIGVVAVGLVAILAGPAPSALPESRQNGVVDTQEECSSTDTMAPEHFETPIVGDWATDVTLDVHVLAVEFTPDQAAHVMREVAELYEPLGIRVDATIEPVSLEIEVPPNSSPGGVLPNASHSGAFIQASKDHFGGVRPWSADVVYTMLGGELASTVAGQADCVGGIAYPDAAFAVGEAVYESAYTIRRSAKIAGHEIAHLLGAHHHFANCAEGNKQDPQDRLYPCTLMFNDVGLISLAFSTLEGAVVRRWALDYANETPTSPPLIPRTVTLKLGKRKTATGFIEGEGWRADSCTARVPVTFQRKSKDGWKEAAASSISDEKSAFSFPLGSSGEYRAVVPKIEALDGRICERTVSNKLRAS
jgi:hypothetical protein